MRAALLLLAVGSATLLCAADVTDIHIRNFGEVNAHLFRGGQPTAEGVQQLAAAHTALIVDLREAGPGREEERRLAAASGIQYANIPLHRFTAPTPAEIKRVLALLTPDDAGPIFVHCWRGKDRTGEVIAAYRIQHDGWTPAQALREARRYGMSRAEVAMRSFILHFRPVDLPPAK